MVLLGCDGCHSQAIARTLRSKANDPNEGGTKEPVTVSTLGFDSAQYPTQLSSQQIRFLADQGVSLCRRGEWKRGFEVLSAVAETEHREGELPGVFYSYLGYALARYRRDLSVARALAMHSTETRFFEPENFLNLARIELLAGDRRKAYGSCLQGLRLDPAHPELRSLLDRLGQRRSPLVGFLPRTNPVNRALGRAVHRIGTALESARADDEDEDLEI